MLTAFKILMFICAIFSFLGSISEKDSKAANNDTVVFGISGFLLLLSIVVTKFM